MPAPPAYAKTSPSTSPSTCGVRIPISRPIVGATPIKVNSLHRQGIDRLAPGLTTHIRGNPRDDPGNSYRAASFKGDAESLAILSGVMGAHQPEGLQIDRFKPTVPGFYRVRFSVWGLRWNRTRVEPAIPGVIRKHTVFGKVVGGMDVVRAIGAAEIEPDRCMDPRQTSPARGSRIPWRSSCRPS